MRKKILIVEDEADILRIAAFRLEKAGYEVQVALDGKETLELLQEQRPDLILLDLRLPVVNGCDVCKKMKSDDELKDIPIILFTATAIDDMPEKVGELGVSDFILKPFDYEELLAKVKKFIG